MLHCTCVYEQNYVCTTTWPHTDLSFVIQSMLVASLLVCTESLFVSFLSTSFLQKFWDLILLQWLFPNRIIGNCLLGLGIFLIWSSTERRKAGTCLVAFFAETCWRFLSVFRSSLLIGWWKGTNDVWGFAALRNQTFWTLQVGIDVEQHLFVWLKMQ